MTKHYSTAIKTERQSRPSLSLPPLSDALRGSARTRAAARRARKTKPKCRRSR